MTGSPQTRSSGQVRKSPRKNKVVQKTGKVRKRTTTASRRSLNAKSRGKEIAAKPNPKVNVASDNMDRNDEVEEVDGEEDDVLRQPMRKQIVSSGGALKRKKVPGKARKPMRVLKVHESSSSYDDDTDNSDGEDGKLFADRVIQKPTIAEAVEQIDDDDVYEEESYATATSHEETPPRSSKTQRRLYDDDVEDVQCKRSGRKENGESSFVAHLDVPIRGMSKSESKRNQQEFATQRIKALVTTKVFRKIKFISNDEMLREAMDWVMNKENVPQANRLTYRVVYESVFNDSLNAKRSTCETAGRMIVVDKTIPTFKEQGKELFTIEELCKLRRAETEREKEAFFWFFGEFLACVVGKRQWSAHKQYQLISQATMTGSSDKLVTISDEAFALLMYENYFDKWTTQANAQEGQSVQRERKVIRGKYTLQNSGTSKYGGWSHDGMKRFNYLYNLVEEDRKSPQAPAMEKEFLDYCVRESNNTKAGGRRNDEPATAIEGSASVLQPSYIRAAWDLNHE
jgi:hypothetical protein